MIMDEDLCNAEVIDGRGSLSCWLWLCEGLLNKHKKLKCKCYLSLLARLGKVCWTILVVWFTLLFLGIIPYKLIRMLIEMVNTTAVY